MRNLKDIFLSNPLVKIVIESNAEAYLVGGYIRDAMRGIASTDMDFVVRGDLHGVIRGISSVTGGKIIEFKKPGFELVRIAAGNATIDFSELRGKIEDNLSKRDYTMNAIAWAQKEGLIDPYNGCTDIRNNLIRPVSEHNLKQDPLRMLRAYRFAGELGWTIDSGFSEIVRHLQGAIRLSASERITLELFKLLNSPHCIKALKHAMSDGVLSEILFLNPAQLAGNFKALSRFDLHLKEIPEKYRINLNRIFSQGLSFMGLLRADVLLCNAELDKCALTLSNGIHKRLTITAKALSAYKKYHSITREDIFELFNAAGEAVMEFVLLTGDIRLIKEAEIYLNIKGILTAGEIQGMAGGVSGAGLGRLIKEMKKLQFTGKITNRESAMTWLIHKASA